MRPGTHSSFERSRQRYFLQESLRLPRNPLRDIAVLPEENASIPYRYLEEIRKARSQKRLRPCEALARSHAPPALDRENIQVPAYKSRNRIAHHETAVPLQPQPHSPAE